MTINIENEYEGFPQFEKTLDQKAEDIIEKTVVTSLDYEDCPYECSVNVLFTDDDSIHVINMEQRGIDRSTDVLSFPMVNYVEASCFEGFDEKYDLFDPETGELMLGDIVISIDHVIKQATEYGHSRTRELAFLTAHSMLHLMGYDHMDDGERKVMEERQREILEIAGFPR